MELGGEHLDPFVTHRRPSRSRLRVKLRAHGGRATAHALAHAAVLLLALCGAAPALAVLAACVLLLRALRGFGGAGQAATAKRVGVLEVCFGALTVAAVAAGHALGW